MAAEDGETPARRRRARRSADRPAGKSAAPEANAPASESAELTEPAAVNTTAEGIPSAVVAESTGAVTDSAKAPSPVSPPAQRRNRRAGPARRGANSDREAGVTGSGEVGHRDQAGSATASRATPAIEAPAADSVPLSEPSAPAVFRPSNAEPLYLPERSRHDGTRERTYRPRRSATRLPAFVDPVDTPDDAAGRVEFVVLRALDDRDEPEPAAPVEAATSPTLRLGSGWVAVAMVAVVLIAIFAAGMLLIR